jgi:hypothetical protein
MEGLIEELNTVLKEATIMPKKKKQTSSFVDHYKKEPERVTNRTLMEQKVTRMYVEHWDGQGAWQTVQQRTYMFINTTKKVPKVDEQNDNVRRFSEDQVVQLEYSIGMPQRPHTGNSPNGLHSSTQQTLGFVNKTDLENNETCCLSVKHLLTCSEERNYTNNGQLAGLLPHQLTFGSSTHLINNRCSDTNIKPRKNSSIGPQTAIPSSQLQSFIRDDKNGQQKVQRDVKLAKRRGQQHHRDVVHKSHSYTNAVTGVEDDKAHQPPHEMLGSYQTDVYLSQSESSDNTSVLAVRESRRHHGDAIYEKCLFTNDKPTREGRNNVYILYGGRENLMEGKIISKRQTAHSMPSQIHEEGHVPMTKHPTCPRMHIEVPNGPQMAIPLIQMQSSDKRGTPMPKGSRQCCSDEAYMKHSFTSDESTRWASWNHQTDMDLSQAQPSIKSNAPGNRETRQRHGDIIHGGQPNMNDKYGEQLMNASGRGVVVLREGRNDICTSYGGCKNLAEKKVSKRLRTQNIV